MVYRLETNENIATGIRGVLKERIHEVVNDLTNPLVDRDKGVHNARKNFKRLRAALRLLRGEIGDDLYQQENVRFRDTARHLASSRDSWVMVEALDKLVTGYNLLLSPHAFTGVRQTLICQYEKVKQSQSEDALIEVIRTIQHAQIENLPIQGEDFSVVQDGLRQTYRQGQKAMAQAYAQPTPEAFHEWRKCVKYLWYQLEILAALSPTLLADVAEQLHVLSEYLGDDHDLAVLRRTVLEDTSGFEEESELLALVSLIDQQRLILQATAHPLGQRIYAETPKAFVSRVKSEWKILFTEDRNHRARLVDEIGKASPPSMFSVNGTLTTQEIALRLGLSVEKVRELIYTNKLPAEKAGNVWMIKVGEL